MARKYLDEIGCEGGYDPNQDLYTDEDKLEERRTQFAVERGVYGFDSSETWNLDTTMLHFLYERLMMLREKGSEFVDYTFHIVEVGGEEKNVAEWMDLMIDSARFAISMAPKIETSEAEQLVIDKTKRVWEIWAVLHPYMWW